MSIHTLHETGRSTELGAVIPEAANRDPQVCGDLGSIVMNALNREADTDLDPNNPTDAMLVKARREFIHFSRYASFMGAGTPETLGRYFDIDGNKAKAALGNQYKNPAEIREERDSALSRTIQELHDRVKAEHGEEIAQVAKRRYEELTYVDPGENSNRESATRKPDESFDDYIVRIHNMLDRGEPVKYSDDLALREAQDFAEAWANDIYIKPEIMRLHQEFGDMYTPAEHRLPVDLAAAQLEYLFSEAESYREEGLSLIMLPVPYKHVYEVFIPELERMRALQGDDILASRVPGFNLPVDEFYFDGAITKALNGNNHPRAYMPATELKEKKEILGNNGLMMVAVNNSNTNRLDGSRSLEDIKHHDELATDTAPLGGAGLAEAMALATKIISDYKNGAIELGPGKDVKVVMPKPIGDKYVLLSVYKDRNGGIGLALDALTEEEAKAKPYTVLQSITV